MKDIHIIRELAAEYAQAANSDQNREKNQAAYGSK